MKNIGNNDTKKRYYNKKVDLFRIIFKIKLWPSRRGVLHGIKSITRIDTKHVRITTHCNEEFIARNSRNCRAVRWLRNKWHFETCSACSIPDWKITKYLSTHFNRHYGSTLENMHDKS
ncbi:MAG: pyrrolysine--tRNA(Pyl) ligase small subunit [Thermodesulfobacteriota bacterium]